MKIAVCSQNCRTVTGHAGKCRRFRIFHVDGQQVTEADPVELPLDGTFRVTAGEAGHPLYAMDALITTGMGEGLACRLRAQRVRPFVTELDEPLEAVRAFLASHSTQPEAITHV